MQKNNRPGLNGNEENVKAYKSKRETNDLINKTQMNQTRKPGQRNKTRQEIRNREKHN